MSSLFSRNRESFEPSKTTLRHEGNLTYLEFIGLVRRIWQEAHPEIPLRPTGADQDATYPCIVYSLELRKAHPDDPKPRYRETRYQGDKAEVITGQRFQNVVEFTAIAEDDPDLSERLIELFEDFMLEFTNVFKRLGLSEITYGRRIPDKFEARTGASVDMRAVNYLVTTEKIITRREERLQDIIIKARLYLEQDHGAIYRSDQGTIYDSSPRFYLSDSDTYLEYSVAQEDIDEASSPEQVAVNIPQTNFRIGDRIYLLPDLDATPSSGLETGFYVVTGFADFAPYTDQMRYTIEAWNMDEATPSQVSVSITSPSFGKVYYFTEELSASLLENTN